MMNDAFVDQDLPPAEFAGINPVTEKMIRIRATELALINGRALHEVSPFDWEQAKRELFYESESERWNPESDSSGNQLRSENDLSPDGGDLIPPFLDVDLSPRKPEQELNGDLTQRQIDE